VSFGIDPVFERRRRNLDDVSEPGCIRRIPGQRKIRPSAGQDIRPERSGKRGEQDLEGQRSARAGVDRDDIAVRGVFEVDGRRAHVTDIELPADRSGHPEIGQAEVRSEMGRNDGKIIFSEDVFVRLAGRKLVLDAAGQGQEILPDPVLRPASRREKKHRRPESQRPDLHADIIRHGERRG